MFTPFQRWALSHCPVPALGLKALGTCASHDELVRRSFETSFDLCEQSDANLAQTLINLGALDYLKEDL
jgi:hypothetical protein